MAELVAIQVPMPVVARRVWVGWKPLVERLEALPVRSGGAELVPPLALRSWMIGGSPQQPSLVRMGVGLFPIPETLGLSFPWLVLVLQVCQQKGPLVFDPPPSLEGPLLRTLLHRRRRGTTSPPPLTPLHLLPASVALLQQAD